MKCNREVTLSTKGFHDVTRGSVNIPEVTESTMRFQDVPIRSLSFHRSAMTVRESLLG